MRTLITGGAGFIGALVARTLVERGDEVELFDVSFDHARMGALAGKVSTRRGNVALFTDVLDAFKSFRPESVYHLGALLSASAAENPVLSYHVNIDGSFHVLEAARLMDVKKVVYTSSIASFGPGVPDPVPNEYDQKPTTIYGVSKVFTERLGEYYHREFSLGFRAVRLPSILGPGRGGGGASAYSTFLLEKPVRGEPCEVWCEERTRIPLLFIDDAVRAVVGVHDAGEGSLKRSSYNIQGFSPTAGEMAQAVAAKVPGARISFKPDPKMQAILDSWPRSLDDSAARSEWGWRPGVDLDGTIDRYIEAARKA